MEALDWGATFTSATSLERSLVLHLDLVKADTRERVEIHCHTDRSADLFFRGKPSNRAALIGDLFVAHERAVGEGMARTFVTERLSEAYGKLATGPARLLEKYASVLEAHRVEPSLIPSSRAPVIAQALVLGGAKPSWVIARDFDERWP